MQCKILTFHNSLFQATENFDGKFVYLSDYKYEEAKYENIMRLHRPYSEDVADYYKKLISLEADMPVCTRDAVAHLGPEGYKPSHLIIRTFANESNRTEFMQSGIIIFHIK